jgi:hypothetical protein
MDSKLSNNSNNNNKKVGQCFFVKNYDQSTLAQWLKESVVKYVYILFLHIRFYLFILALNSLKIMLFLNGFKIYE